MTMLAGYVSRIPIARWLTFSALSLIIVFVDMLHVRRDIAEDLNRYFGTRYTIIISTLVHPLIQYSLYARCMTSFGPVERDLASKIATNFYQHIGWRFNTTMRALQNIIINQNIVSFMQDRIMPWAVGRVCTACFAICLYYMCRLWEQHVHLRPSHCINRLRIFVPNALVRVIAYVPRAIVALAVSLLFCYNSVMVFTPTTWFQRISTFQDRYSSRAVVEIFTAWIAITLYVLVREPDEFPPPYTRKSSVLHKRNGLVEYVRSCFEVLDTEEKYASKRRDVSH